MDRSERPSQPFVVQLIKPSHYDDDGYVIQWVRAFIPSNSLACVHALVEDVGARGELGDDVELVLDSYDECHTTIPVQKIIRRIQAASGIGLVMLVGVQTNQFARAAVLAREFREAGVAVAIGGFHVSGCISMLPELPPEIQELQDIGVSLFAGEAEGRMARVLRDALHGRLEPIYNYLTDMPNLEGAVRPSLPIDIARKYMLYTSFDAGRGCPFQCSFCTIINVQGRKSRTRSADDVEQIVRSYWSQGVKRFFICDDNFSRNQDWEAILDRLIQLREEDGLRFKFLMQVDTTCHRIPGFIEKAAAAGCRRVFIGLENINPENLKAAGKRHNRIDEYREMLQAWRAQRVLTYAGYILGFPADTPESIERDIGIIQRELPVDILEFMLLTPLPGSADHQRAHAAGVWTDPDTNKYDLEHVTTRDHKNMTADELQAAYDAAWHQYYSPEHIETLIRRGGASGAHPRRIAAMIWQFYGSYAVENLHPIQAGVLRRKHRRSRRPGFPRENALLFYPRYIASTLRKSVRQLNILRRITRVTGEVRRDPDAASYSDRAIRSAEFDAAEPLEMLRPRAAEGAEGDRVALPTRS